jgi:hypothetical protein
MRSPLGDLLHDLLDMQADIEDRRAVWADADRRLMESTADRLVELEVAGLGSLAARIEARIARAREAIRTEPHRLQSDPDAEEVTFDRLRDAKVLVDATDRRVPSQSAVPVSETPARGAGNEGFGDGDAQIEVPPLTDNEVAVITTLARFDPLQLASASKIEAEMDASNRRSPRTIGKAVTRLIELGLAERPRGDRSGARLTTAGRRVARKVAD